MEVQNFSLKIKDKIIFDSVNLTFKQGYLNIISGKNGVGKTLLIDLISNIDNNRPKEFLNFPPAKNIIYQTQGVPFHR